MKTFYSFEIGFVVVEMKSEVRPVFMQSCEEGLSSKLKETESKLTSLQADMHPGKLVLSVHRAQLSLIRVRRRALRAEALKHKIQNKHLSEAEEKLKTQLKTTKKELQVPRSCWILTTQIYIKHKHTTVEKRILNSAAVHSSRL